MHALGQKLMHKSTSLVQVLLLNGHFFSPLCLPLVNMQPQQNCCVVTYFLTYFP